MSNNLPDPAHFPSYRRPSAKAAPTFDSAEHRALSAGAFTQGARAYHDVRPAYPAAVARLVADAATVLDVGAGTGKLALSLLNDVVFACDPSPAMLRALRAQAQVPAWRATAEHTALKDDSVDAITCAQTWHWVDVQAASAEFDRVLRPGGTVLLVWNTLAVEADPWILRLARIMHSGDIQRPGFVPEVAAPWVIAQTLRTTWCDELTGPQLHELMHTRSYWLRNGEKIRRRMTANLDWYLYEHLGFNPAQPLAIPYRTDAFLLSREDC